MAQGMQAAVLRYHTAPDFHDPVPVLELAWSVQYVRQHADAFHVNPDAVFVIGFSAGAHLVAHLCTRWRDPVFQQVLTPGISWRPDAQILCYPVISMMDFAHEGSCCNLLGERASDPLERDRCSLERHVSSDVPPTFLWHTVEDESVPVENSMMYASALRRSGVPFEMHLFEQGRHGLSTCDDTVSDSDSGILPDNAVWVDMAVRFLKRRIHCGGSAYGTVEQGS